MNDVPVYILTHNLFVTFSLPSAAEEGEVIEWFWWASGVHLWSTHHTCEDLFSSGFFPIFKGDYGIANRKWWGYWRTGF